MPSRKRIRSQMKADDVSSVITMSVAPKSALTGATTRVGETNRIHNASSVIQNEKLPSITYRQLLDSWFPKVRYEFKGYGSNLYGFTSNVGAFVANYERGALFNRPLNCGRNRQVWFESIGLPLWHMKKQTNNPDTNCSLPGIMSVADLQVLAYAAMKGAQPGYKIDTGLPQNPSTPQDFGFNNTYMATGNTLTSGFKVAFCYLGGFQRHTFKNITENDCHVEIFELHPRDYQVDWKSDLTAATGQLAFKSVGDLLVNDFQLNDEKVNSTSLFEAGQLTYASSSTDSYSSVNDIAVRIRSDSRLVHSKYKVSKGMRFLLKPGDTLNYTMRFPAFSFDEASFMQDIQTIAVGGSATFETGNKPTSVPKFTKRLVVRAYGEAGVQNTETTYNGLNQSNFHAATGGVTLTHLLKEYHSVRYMPEANRDLKITRDFLSEDSAGQFVTINEEDDTFNNDASATDVFFT